MNASISSSAPVFCSTVDISVVDQNYLQNRQRYEQLKRMTALQLKRKLIRQRGCFQKRLEKALSLRLRNELDIQVVLDTQYLKAPEFVGVFEESGNRWTLGYRPAVWNGRWFFRSPLTSTLYSCTSSHLETQLCYALGQSRLQSMMYTRV